MRLAPSVRALTERNEPVNDSLLLVKIADTLGDLSDDVPRELLGEVSELDDLVEELSAFHKSAGEAVSADPDEACAVAYSRVRK